MHSQEGAEFCFHLDAFYEFCLENVALVGKLENSGSKNFVLSIITPLIHSSNTCVLTWRSQGPSVVQIQEANPSCDIIALTWLNSVARSKSGACFPDDMYTMIVQLLTLPISDLIRDVHTMGLQLHTMHSKECKRNNCMCSGIRLVGTLLILIELEHYNDKISFGIKHGMQPLCVNTRNRTLVLLLFEWPLSPVTEFLVGNLAAYLNSC